MGAKNFLKEKGEVGIYYYDSKDSLGKPDKIYYIVYRKDGRVINSKIGRKSEGWTKAKVRNERAFIVSGQKLPPKEEKKRKERQKRKSKKWTLIKLWEYYVANKDKYKGYSKEKGLFENHIRPVFGQREPRTLTMIEIDSFKRKLKQKRNPLSEQTIKNVLAMLKRICNYGKKNDFCEGLKFVLELKNVDNVIKEDLNKNQINSLLEVLQNSKNIESTIMKVMLLTGRRTAEICGLEWMNIDYERQLMTLVDTKTGYSETLPFSDEVKRIFENIHPKHKIFVFPNSKGEKKTRTDRAARKFMIEAGLPENYRPTYCLRQTFFSFAFNYVKIPYYNIQILTGHKVAKNTVTSRYLHIDDEILLNQLNDYSKIILKLHPESYSKSVYLS